MEATKVSEVKGGTKVTETVEATEAAKAWKSNRRQVNNI
jgi:hypothetical protein